MNPYPVAPTEAFQLNVGTTVSTVPLGESWTGTGGGADTVNAIEELIAVPASFVAETAQLYSAFGSGAAGVTEQLPVPAPQPAPLAETT